MLMSGVDGCDIHRAAAATARTEYGTVGGLPKEDVSVTV